MIHCLIIDDEPLATELIADHIKQTKGLALDATFINPIEAIEYLKEHAVDLIFLDVQMPEITGIQFMRIIKDKIPIILSTAYQEYAVDGFDFDVVDYLLKPISYERFYQAIEKFSARQTQLTISKQGEQIFVRSEYKTIRIETDSILYIEGMGDYLIIHCNDSKDSKHYVLETLKQLEELLPKQNFMRVHKSYIIAINKIKSIERNQISITDQLIPIGETYRKQFWQRIEHKP